MKWNALADETCSLARSLSVVGDRWALLILRDALLGVRRFEDFQVRLGIARRVLTERLTALVDAGVFDRVPYQERPVRHEYRLTSRGRDLHPVVLSLIRWGDLHLAGVEGAPAIHHHVTCGQDFDPVTTCSACGEAVDSDAIRTRAAGWVSTAHEYPSLNGAS